MASGITKKPGAQECPPELECLIGSAGPYVHTDKAEFHHVNQGVQEWIIRLDPHELELIQYGLSLAYGVRSAVKWAKRVFWAFTAGLSGVLLAGEKLAKLPETISGALSGVSAAFRLAKSWWGA